MSCVVPMNRPAKKATKITIVPNAAESIEPAWTIHDAPMSAVYCQNHQDAVWSQTSQRKSTVKYVNLNDFCLLNRSVWHLLVWTKVQITPVDMKINNGTKTSGLWKSITQQLPRSSLLQYPLEQAKSIAEGLLL
mmetsp:Transcript_58533/g.105187  ORF Transcript_58533/g.105187 Transcript_58533/m.105187 type:complete len:134 (-) Transcript_58533:108-509(-)